MSICLFYRKSFHDAFIITYFTAGVVALLWDGGFFFQSMNDLPKMKIIFAIYMIKRSARVTVPCQ